MCYITYVQSIWMCHPTYYTYLIYFTARDQRINKFLLNLLWKKLIANTIDAKLHVFYNNFNCPISAGGSLIVNLIGLGKGTSVWQVIFFTREHGLPCVMPDFVFIFICTAIFFCVKPITKVCLIVTRLYACTFVGLMMILWYDYTFIVQYCLCVCSRCLLLSKGIIYLASQVSLFSPFPFSDIFGNFYISSID